MDDITSIGFWVKNFGPVGAIAFAVGYGLKRICSFLAPHVTTLITSHVDFLKAVENNITAQSNQLQSIAQVQSDHGEKITQIHQKVVS